jgi:hypothetical protein
MAQDFEHFNEGHLAWLSNLRRSALFLLQVEGPFGWGVMSSQASATISTAFLSLLSQY